MWCNAPLNEQDFVIHPAPRCLPPTKWWPGASARPHHTQHTLAHTTFQNSQEFVIHSPTLSATKWWPGGLGKTSTHAIVMARLMLPDGRGGVRDHGPHAFIVQVCFIACATVFQV